MRYLVIVAAILAASGAAFAQFNGCPPGFCPGLNSGGAPIPPPTCTGTINLSTGCVQPMLR